MKIPSIVSALALAVLAGCGAHPTQITPSAAAAPTAVKAVALAPLQWPETYEATGTVRARTAAVIAAKVMGYVREVAVRPGDRVRRGQWLVRLEARELEAAWRQAEAALEEARSAAPEADNAVAAAQAGLELAQVTFRRMEDLFSKRSISNQEYDEAAARLKLAQANYQMARSRRQQLTAKIQQAEQALKAAAAARGWAEIAAPFDGLVTDKSVEPGNLAAPGAPLLAIEAEDSYRLEVPVEEFRLAAVRTGQKVEVRLDALQRELEGRVSEIVPAVDAAARAFLVKIDLPPIPGLRSGLYGRAVFAVGRRSVLAVPAEAVRERGQLAWVLTAEQGQARARLITLGRRRGEQIEVLSGVNAGELVIAPVPPGLAEGAAVEVRP